MATESIEKRSVILLTQELGFYKGGILHGRESTAKIAVELEKQGCRVKQLEISKCEIKENSIYYKDSGTSEKVQLQAFHAVIERSWDGGVNANHGSVVQKIMEENELYADNPSSAQDITHDRKKMQEAFEEINDLKTPKTYFIDKYDKDSINEIISTLRSLHTKKNLGADIHEPRAHSVKK